MKKIPALLAAAVSAIVLASCSSTSSSTPTPAAPTSAPATAGATSADDTVSPDGNTSSATESEATESAPSSSSSTASSLDSSGPSATPAAGKTAITINVGDTVVNATLNDSQVSRDFIRTLPTTLPWFRNSGIEYITELPEPLTETGPFYTDVQPGDLVYYNPADSITIIYEETVAVPTLTFMGRITSDLAAFRDLPDDVEMRIELA